MTNKLNPFVIEDKQKESLKRLTEAGNLYDSIMTEFKKQQDKEIIDMIIGNKPFFQHLLSLYKKKDKEKGELLLGNKDWSAFIDALRESLSKEDVPIKVKKNMIDLSAYKSTEQGLIQQLGQIIEIQNIIINNFIVLINSLLQEREYQN